MKTKRSFSFLDRLRSFRYAFQGLKSFFQTEHNSWIHLFATFGVIFLGYYLSLTNLEWCILLIAIGLVFIAEIINTAIETLTDAVSPNYSAMAKKVKDFSAAAVLISAIVALCIAALIFTPKLIGPN